MTDTSVHAWPALPVDAWADTRDTVHMWTQIVGKIRMALMPMINHWWQVALYVTARGLTTSVMPYGTNGLEIEFDFVAHTLELRTTDGRQRTLRLEPRSVADFYAELMATLSELGMPVRIVARPVEVPVAIPFASDHEHASYDAARMHAFWLSLVQAERPFVDFRSRFVGKASPVHFFWGAFDLAVTRFSGRTAPRHPGGVPNCPDWVMVRAYSHEVSSAGYWPGWGDEGAFYSYAYPEPAGYRDRPSEHGRYDEQLGEFLLPYRTVREAHDPDALLLGFLQETYEAAADCAHWDREALEAR
ncbi:MAG: hypothetical protein JWL73_2068 [Actinomycetia bacterium]|nr:hypothetical protein [Actinomycetes bacterium]